MDKNFDTWFSRFMWGTDVVFLAASTPHIAEWYAHFDHPSNFVSTVYAYGVGYGLAIAIDGVSLLLLFALTRMIARGQKDKGLLAGILFFMVFITGLSWFINWQYDVQFANDAFSVAEKKMLWGSVTVGTLNPIIGGAFSILIMAYALVSKVVKTEEKPVMTDAEYEQEKRRIERENALKALRNPNNKGILARGKEVLIGQGQGTDELLEIALTYLRDARELLPEDQEERACQALSAYLKIRSKQVLPLLIQARGIIAKEDQDRLISDALSDQEGDQESGMSDSNSDQEGESEADQTDMLGNLQGRETVSVETAAQVLNCQPKYVVRLRNAGKLKHGAKRPDMITVASLRAYQASRGRRGTGAGEQRTEPLNAVRSNQEAMSV